MITDAMIEAAAQAMFECGSAYGRQFWTWDTADKVTQTYWQTRARAALEAAKDEAANEIARLRSENDRMRNVLELIAGQARDGLQRTQAIGALDDK